MRINKKIIIVLCLVSILSMGCSRNNKENEFSAEKIENHIPYIDENSSEIDNRIINERYEKINKEDLTYKTIFEETAEDSETLTYLGLANSIKDDALYKDILLGFTYYSEINPSDLTYEQAMELVKKVLPEDIKEVDSITDKEVNKEYIYYESSKGNFRVGLCYGYEFNDDNVEVLNKDKIVGIDYSKEIDESYK